MNPVSKLEKVGIVVVLMLFAGAMYFAVLHFIALRGYQHKLELEGKVEVRNGYQIQRP